MDRGTTAHPLSWLLVPVAGALVASALSLPAQPYTGLIMRDDRVVVVVPASPGARAGLRAGDCTRCHLRRQFPCAWMLTCLSGSKLKGQGIKHG